MGDWRGIPREEIPWFPTIDTAICIGCKECLNFCKNDVLAFDDTTTTAVVQHQYNCVVECRTCARICPVGAISFPDESEFTKWVKEKLAAR